MDEMQEACQYELKKRLDEMVIPILQMCLGTNEEGTFLFQSHESDLDARLFAEEALRNLPRKITEFIVIRDTLKDACVLDGEAFDELYTHYDNF